SVPKPRERRVLPGGPIRFAVEDRFGSAVACYRFLSAEACFGACSNHNISPTPLSGAPRIRKLRHPHHTRFGAQALARLHRSLPRQETITNPVPHAPQNRPDGTHPPHAARRPSGQTRED